jgi:hypothetical protein
MSEIIRDILNLPSGPTRFRALKAAWDGLHTHGLELDRRGQAIAGNSYSSTLTTAFLMDGAVTDLQNRWAALAAFSVNFSTDPYKPKATGELKHVTVGSTTGTDLTNFETGTAADATVVPATVVMHQYTQPFQVSNTDLQSGLRMGDLVTINSALFANKVIEVATAPITRAIFTATPLVSAAAAFGFSDLATLQGQLKKSPIKNLVLDGAYLARISNSPGFFQKVGTMNGNPNAWAAFGWDYIAGNSDWTGADTGVVGFACHPQAIAGVTGLPAMHPNIPGNILGQTTMVVPGIQATVAFYTWMNTATRTMWASYDIMAGFKEVDTTAGIIVASS